MNLPADLSPETSAWMQTQIVINNARTAAVLREEINKVDDWANGVFAALRDVLMYQLRRSPGMGGALAPSWGDASQAFDMIDLYGQAPQPDEPLEYLEARKMLYRQFVLLGLMPRQGECGGEHV